MTHRYWPRFDLRLQREEILQRMRLDRATWLARHRDHGVRVTGLAGCRHLSG